MGGEGGKGTHERREEEEDTALAPGREGEMVVAGAGGQGLGNSGAYTYSQRVWDLGGGRAVRGGRARGRNRVSRTHSACKGPREGGKKGDLGLCNPSRGLLPSSSNIFRKKEKR